MKKLTVGLLAHVDAGKTTLSEAMLYVTGTIRKLGRVDHRDTFLDTHSLERERGITIFSKQARLHTEGLDLTLLDTPGHADFSGETERTMPVLDAAILVISGTDGVQAHTETLWELLERYHVPTFVFVTKMDAASRPTEALLTELRERFGEGCMDLSHREDEAVAMLDEHVLDRYLETGTVSDGDISRLIGARKLFPVCFGSGLKLTGVEELMDLLEAYTPVPAYPDAFGARVYKIARDSRGERLTYLKVTGGTLSVRDSLAYPPAPGGELIEEKVAQLRLYSGAKYETANTVAAGETCAVTGLSATWPGQGLGAEPDTLPPLLAPAMAYRLLLPPEVDARTLLPKLRQLEEEEPLLHVVWQERLGEIHLQLMGAVQIEVLQSLLRDRFDAEVGIDAGRILYRETIANAVEGVGHFEPLRHYAEVHLLLEPGEPGSGIVVGSQVREDDLDLNWQRLILTHLEEKQHIGVLTGSPLTDVKITLIAGRAHLKHTEGGDFRQATYRAVRQGLMQAESVLLEPYYSFRLDLPGDCIGRAISDVHGMGGTHDAPEALRDRMILTGTAPVSAMADYGAEVAAYTRGRGRFSCHVAGYQPCRNADAVIAAMGYDPEADVENTPDSVFCAHGAGFAVRWKDVPEYMHLDSRRRDRDGGEPTPRVIPRNLDIDEKELEAIMEREFGPIRRKVYSTPQINSAVGIQMQARKRKEWVIVDGYNVIFSWDELRTLAERDIDLARKRLADMLVNYRAYTKNEVVLVFDAYNVPGGQGSKYTDARLRIAFTKEGETADMYIERLVGEIGKNEAVRVVTSDSLIRLTALRSGVLRCSSGEFEGEVRWVLDRIGEIVKKTQE